MDGLEAYLDRRRMPAGAKQAGHGGAVGVVVVVVVTASTGRHVRVGRGMAML